VHVSQHQAEAPRHALRHDSAIHQRQLPPAWVLHEVRQRVASILCDCREVAKSCVAADGQSCGHGGAPLKHVACFALSLQLVKRARSAVSRPELEYDVLTVEQLSMQYNQVAMCRQQLQGINLWQQMVPAEKDAYTGQAAASAARSTTANLAQQTMHSDACTAGCTCCCSLLLLQVLLLQLLLFDACRQGCASKQQHAAAGVAASFCAHAHRYLTA
jgi:hypothetical protein